MKKITSLIMSALLLAAMLSVFAVPAFAADEPTTPEDYKALAQQLEDEGKYEEAADAYLNAGRLFMEDESRPAEITLEYAAEVFWSAAMLLNDLGNHTFAGSTFMNAGYCYAKLNNADFAAYSYSCAASAYEDGGDPASAAEACMRAGDYFIKAGDWDAADLKFDNAVQLFTDDMPFSTATAYLGKAYALQKGGRTQESKSSIDLANDILNGIFGINYNIGSVLSNGNVAIIAGIVMLALGFVGGILLGKKKKPVKEGEE